MGDVIDLNRPQKVSLDEFMEEHDPAGIQRAYYTGSLKTLYDKQDQLMVLYTILDFLDECHNYYLEAYPDDVDSYVYLFEEFIDNLKEKGGM